MIPVPNLLAPLVNKIGRVIPPWNSFFQQFTQAPGTVNDITVGTSPFVFVATEPGTLIITGGTISDVHLIRGVIAIELTGLRIIPVSIKDAVQITYSVLPILQFLPSLGQSPQ